MEQFYNNLAGTAQSLITKAQALRQAQLSLIRSDRTTPASTNSRNSLEPQPRPGAQASANKELGLSLPYYWAPFILIGNGL